jgi:hypothetical protein
VVGLDVIVVSVGRGEAVGVGTTSVAPAIGVPVGVAALAGVSGVLVGEEEGDPEIETPGTTVGLGAGAIGESTGMFDGLDPSVGLLGGIADGVNVYLGAGVGVLVVSGNVNSCP